MGLVFQSLTANNKLRKRVAITIWLYHANEQYKLRRYGDIVYFSRKNNYVMIYVDANQAKETLRELGTKSFVKKADLSHHSELDFSAEHEEQLIAKLKLEAEQKLEKNGDELI